MTVSIKIPKEFEEHYASDKFDDSLARIYFDVNEHAVLSGKYEAELVNMLRRAFKESSSDLEQENADLKRQNENLIAMLETERAMKVNDDFVKKIAEYEDKIERLKKLLELQ